ncbi:hypothetical protein F5J12DRAFT_851338 [Pisolithus orientalis]|uniref:uncharacterized protein n=1 Tax=Pisolithus orientalis TaxID=936130 RepID=UPI0022257BBA|nr:uncharacterized protein F5J12DRAFT_851338 [Pisolithus orientalis]KAI5997691.1 hypothetical protein F5J12DRAFT_851338 [Pisolithus orientalis]
MYVAPRVVVRFVFILPLETTGRCFESKGVMQRDTIGVRMLLTLTHVGLGLALAWPSPAEGSATQEEGGRKKRERKSLTDLVCMGIHVRSTYIAV